MRFLSLGADRDYIRCLVPITIKAFLFLSELLAVTKWTGRFPNLFPSQVRVPTVSWIQDMRPGETDISRLDISVSIH